MFLRISLLLATSTGMVLGQGTVFFSTHVGSLVNAPVMFSGGALASGTGPLASLGQLYAALPGQTLQPVGQPIPFRSDVGVGYITAGGEVTIPGTEPGGAAQVKLVAWVASQGASYAEVIAAGAWWGFGESAVIMIENLGGGLEPAVPLVGLSGFSMTDPSWPEPSPIALGILGASVLGMWRVRRGRGAGSKVVGGGLPG